MTREERIRQYAYEWYQIRRSNRLKGDAHTDWLKAEHIVNGEDWSKQMEEHYVAENHK